MDEKKLGLRLKYKLLILLTAIPVVSLSLYIALATRLFENDKIAYVKDSSVAVARSLAVQFRLEISGFVEKIKPIVETYDQSTQKFTDISSVLFAKQERLDGLLLIQKSATGNYVKIAEIHKDNQFGNKFAQGSAEVDQLRDAVLKDKLVVSTLPYSEMHLAIATVVGNLNEINHIIVIGLYRANDLYAAFVKTNIYKHFLLDKNGEVLLGPLRAVIYPMVRDGVMKASLPEGALDIASEQPKIVSYSDTNIADMKVIAIADRKEALAAVNALLIKSILFFIALISTTIIISVIASVKLTSALRELYDATKLIANGQFDVRIKKHSNDEVGGLADGFNFMAGEVSRLMIETSVKARMANELETVRLVQETLFPLPESKFGKYQVSGHFEPASECGGDWWNYCQIGDKLYLWIGDATGHGASAAMVTSAAKSAASIIEDLPYITPGKALEIMNKAIHETAKCKILMTFFIAAIDLKSGEMTYANASHEPPYIIRAKKGDGPVTKKDLEPLIEAHGARLGDKRSSQYAEAKVQLNEGDSILFYTDGIVDLKSPAGKAWGERGFIKSICESASAGPTASDKINKLKLNISNYREATDLVDDITLILCHYGDVA